MEDNGDIGEICKPGTNMSDNNNFMIEGKVINISETMYEFMDERIFRRGNKRIHASYLDIKVNEEIHRIMFPMSITLDMAKEMIDQTVRVSKTQNKYRDPKEWDYKEDTYNLIILSGQKDQKYERKIIH